MHEDLAILTGGSHVTQELGLTLDNIQLWQLGRAERVVVDRDTTTIIGGRGDPEAVEQRIRQLRVELEENGHLNEYERDKLRERMARLGGQVAVIRVGAATETELRRAHAPGRGRGAGDPRGAPRGDPPGRRRRAAERRRRRSTRRASRPTRRPAPRSSAARSRSRCARSPRNAGFDPSVVVGDRPRAEAGRGPRRRDRRLLRSLRGGHDRPDARHPLGARARRLDRQDSCSSPSAWSRARPREDDLVREAREVNDTAHQVVRRPPRDAEVRRRGAHDAASPASTRSPTRSR